MFGPVHLLSSTLNPKQHLLYWQWSVFSGFAMCKSFDYSELLLTQSLTSSVTQAIAPFMMSVICSIYIWVYRPTCHKMLQTVIYHTFEPTFTKRPCPQWFTWPLKYLFLCLQDRKFEPYFNILMYVWNCYYSKSQISLIYIYTYIYIRCYCVKCGNMWFILFGLVLAHSRQGGKSNHKSLLANASNVNRYSHVGKISADK